MIKIENLSKVFKTKDGDFTALQDINLEIAKNDIFGIIGLSGAGKSTLVRCMNMLEVPTEGKVFVDGIDITKLRRRDLLMLRREIGMIFQSFNLLMQRNVADNVAFPLELGGGMDKAQRKARVMELLEIVGLADKAAAYPAQLSGGQRQRVAIARALATKPKILLCDEATSALDAMTTRSILKLLKDINRTMGVTIVVITHEMNVVQSICNRVAVIDNSRIVEMGNTEDVMFNPQSEIAKKLIGLSRSMDKPIE
ncbi:MAG: methionine ABC transporter ATP-binding protein [Clostridia bacterium]